MSAWKFQSFSKRVEYKVEPLVYSSPSFNQPIFIKLDGNIKQYIDNYYDVSFVVKNCGSVNTSSKVLSNTILFNESDNFSWFTPYIQFSNHFKL